MEHRCRWTGEAGRPGAAEGEAGGARAADGTHGPGHRRRGHGTGLPTRQPPDGRQLPRQTKSAAALACCDLAGEISLLAKGGGEQERAGQGVDGEGYP
jgi:hypothetical protein